MNPWDSAYYGANQPLFRVGQVPVYVTTLFVAAQASAMILFALLGYGSTLENALTFSFPAILAGKLWTLVTYAFVDQLNFFSALGLVFFFLFGRRVEEQLGTRRFLILLAVLVIGPTLLLTVLGFVGVSHRDNAFYGGHHIHLTILIAFVWFHSHAIFWPGIPAKWFGVFFVALATLQFLGMRLWVFFWMCLFTLLLGYITLRRMGMGMKFAAIEEPLLSLLPTGKSKGYRSSKRKLRVVKKPKKHTYESKLTPKVEPKTTSPGASVDHLLEKISREGIGSLTDAERKQLEQASDQISKGEP